MVANPYPELERPEPPVDLATWRPDWDFGPIADFPVYTRANVGEVIPGLLSPLGASAGANILDQGFVLLAKMLGTFEPYRHRLPPGIEEGVPGVGAWVGVFYGRAYLNLSLITEGADLIPGTSAAAVEEQYLGGVRHPGAPPRRLTLEEQRIRLTLLPHALRLTLRAPRLTAEQERRVEIYTRREAARNLRAASGEELLALLAHNRRFQIPVAGLHLLNSSAASTGLEMLSRSVRRWLPDAPEGLVERLVTGLPDVESAKPAYDLWRLSRLARADSALRRLFDQGEAGTLFDAVTRAPGSAAAEFRDALAHFLARFGYRAMREAELSSKSWAEDPAFVLATIKSYLALGDEADPFAAHARQEALRMEAEQYAGRSLGLLRRRLFRQQLGVAQRFIALRETTKAQWVRSMQPARAICREAGRRLVEQGLLANAEEVFLLRFDEFDRALRGLLDAPSAQSAVARRRREMAICERIALPEWFEGTPQPRWIGAEAGSVEGGSDGAGSGGAVLTGIAVSPGRVRGRARVITQLDEDAAVEPGEILVAPFTDAAWTPLFFTAAAVVVDLGGPLSHGSTVAREYGLPAVVNVKSGTRQIRTGQEITVDGTRGEVLLH
ncbi:MAG TPA: PEP-utilizing enzyme [Dehalococcoidia bacterium]|nr:PEP-utilizing enzyme [Dehalococcoidia bacterium]